MKWWLLTGALLLLLWPRTSHAQAGFELQFDTAQRVTVKVVGLEDQVCATDEALAEECAQNCPGNSCPTKCSDHERVFTLAKEKVLGPSLVSGAATDTPAAAWIRTLLTREHVSCAPKDPKGVKVGEEGTVAVSLKATKTLQLDGGVSPDAKLPGVLVWTGWEHPHFARLVSQILPDDLSTKKCTISSQGKKVTCHAVQSPLDGGVRLLINHSGAVLSSGTITVELNAGYKLQAEIFGCDYQMTGRLAPALFAGAMLQRIELSSTPDCTTRLAGNALRLANGSVAIVASEVRTGVGGAATLALSNLPTSIPDGAWQLESTSGTRLGATSLRVVNEPLKVKPDTSGNPALDIHYAVDANVELDQWHDGSSVDGQAVVTAARGEYDQYIQNKATIEVADELKNLAKQLTPTKYSPRDAACSTKSESAECKVDDPSKCDEKVLIHDCGDLEEWVESCGMSELLPSNFGRLRECRSMLRAWRITSNSWQQHVWVHEDGLWYRTPVPTPAHSTDLGEITFAVFYPQRQPYSVTVELVDRTGPGALPGSESEADVVFRGQIVLARSARYESLPLPLARALHVQCGEAQPRRGLFPSVPPPTDSTLDVVTNGHTRAVNDEDVTTGNCRLVYSHQRVLSALGLDESEESIDVLKYYGRQELTLKVRRGQAEQEVVWSLDPTVDTDVRLPIPEDAKNATGIYTVVASLRGRLPPAVVYRPGGTTVQTSTSPALGDLEFKANLRPRGPFGWKVAPIRVFMTFPINFTGIRFTARPKELESSSASSNVQVTSVEAGILLAVEPWNYDKGRNLWPVPVRFMTGANLYNLTEKSATPSWITGASLTFPIFDLQKGVAEDQLGTDVALGLFWEVDVAENDWLTSGHHFLATLGLNVLSLFGAK